MKILIATPMHNAECSGLYTRSLLDTVVYLKSKGYDVAYETVMHDALLCRSRNTLVHLFLKTQSQACFLIFEQCLSFPIPQFLFLKQ